MTAKAVYNLPKGDPELNNWSTLSICVTAANLLHKKQFLESHIQTRLRWKSTQFLKYLRNAVYTATQHYTEPSTSHLLTCRPPRSGSTENLKPTTGSRFHKHGTDTCDTLKAY